jgi:tetratricopeptide (TPR) repeat protein
MHERAAYAANLHGLFDVAMGHAQAVETISRDAGDRLGVLRGVTIQAKVHMAEHGEKPAIAILRPALDAVSDLEPTEDIVRAQAELGRALMVGGEYAESVVWCNRVLAAPTVASETELVEAMITKGTALSADGFMLEGEVLLRGAIEIADRMGNTFAALRARNNLLSAIDDLAAAYELIEQGYEMADRFGQRTWLYQFGLVSLTNSFDRGDWDTGITRAQALDAPGFYAAWLQFETGVRAAFRGDLDFARAAIQRGRRLAGTTSSQALASSSSTEGAVYLAAGDFQQIMPLAREGWEHFDSGDGAALLGMGAAVAMNRSDWATEALDAFVKLGRRGRLAEGQTAALQASAALTEARWTDARQKYLQAIRMLEATEAKFWLAILNLGVGMRAAGQFPESAQAMSDAEAFFRSVGAESFVERYRAAFVPSAGGAGPTSVATAPEREAAATQN